MRHLQLAGFEQKYLTITGCKDLTLHAANTRQFRANIG